MERYLGIATILLNSFSAMAFTLMAALRLPSLRRSPHGWGGRAYPLLLVACAVQFVSLAVFAMAHAELRHYLWPLIPLERVSALLIPAFYLHVFYSNERRFLRAVLVWRTCVVLLYGAAIAGLVVTGTGAFEGGQPRSPVLSPLIVSLFAAAGLLTTALLLMSRRSPQESERGSQATWSVAISLALALGVPALYFWETAPVRLLVSFLPPSFILVATYYVERLSFFDVLIKQASFAFLTLLLTTLYFVVMPRWLSGRGLFAWALSLWPVLLLYPWFHRRLSAWIDRSWLGRCYSPAQAGKYFLDGLQGLIRERDLLAAAESRLAEIFQAGASVVVTVPDPPDPAPGFAGMIARLRERAQPVGYVMIEPRESGSRFLSEDQLLLSSLAESTSFLLENIRLREKRIEQETREQELVLNANRSQLKALRAQINPHFLFNALNTIAGLIPEHPDRADRTIERLADVFRYTLCWAEREWVPLDEEIRAVRAYLEVEQARFDDTLTVRIGIGKETEDVRIPSMIVQTLVENAVKHGVSAICDPGLIEIESRIRSGCLIIQVRDNGPGFDEEAMKRAGQGDSNYGLQNTRDRLFGYFGTLGRLRIGRDKARGLTEVEIQIPVKIDRPIDGMVVNKANR